MSLREKACAAVEKAERINHLPVFQQLGAARALLPELGLLLIAMIDEIERGQQEMAELKQKLGGVIGHGA